MDMKLVEEWLSGIPSKYTRKNYMSGIKKFENEYFHKPIETLIKSPEAGREIERFYCWLKERHGQNTCRNVVNANIPPKILAIPITNKINDRTNIKVKIASS